MKMKKILVGMAASTLLLTSTAYANDNELDPLKGKIDEIDQNTGELEEKKKELEGNIASTEQQLLESTNLIQTTSNQINDAQTQIQDTITKIDEKNIMIAQKGEEIKVKEKELGEVIRVLYQNGDTTLLEVLFASKGIKEFVYKVDYMKILASSHQKIRKEIIVMKEQMEKEKIELENMKLTQEQKKAELESLRATQEVQKAQHEALLANLEEDHAHLEEEIHANESAIAAIEGQIAAIIRQREEERRRKEEERRQREEEERKKREQGEQVEPVPEEPSDDVIGSGQLRIPLNAGTYYFSSPFGWRSDPFTGEQAFHSGVDMAAKDGTPIFAADGGTVLFAGHARGYGNWIVIDHNNGLYTIYGHMWDSGVLVSPGQQVKKGQHIGAVGSNGSSTAPHLHFCVANSFSGYAFSYSNPMNYF